MTKEIDSVCTYCGVGCDICAVVENQKIKKVYAKKEGTVSRGKLCVKGKYGWQFLNSPNRLKSARIKQSFLFKNELFFPKEIKDELKRYTPDSKGYIYPSLELAFKITAWKLKELKFHDGLSKFAAIGGARTSCESAYLFQKFTRQVLNSPHIDNCARVCHAPSLKGMRAVIGEGAATNPFDDIEEAEFLIVIGSNMTEAHPIAANRVLNAVRKGTPLALFDVREIALSKFAKYNCIIPFESNLLVLNMLSFVIISEKIYDEDFIKKRTRDFDSYKESILSDPYADPDYFKKLKGFENLSVLIREVARNIASKKTMILWGLGITQQNDGSYAAAAICNLALLCANLGKRGSALMPLRGQNNVQGACDMGCLPYYDVGYKKPLIEGLKTPDIINAIDEGEIKALFCMGEDIAHIHPNQNKIHRALKKLDLLVVNELFENEITKFADIVFGVKSGYEKEGVYINAERRVQLSSVLVNSDLPDDWEVITGIARYIKEDFVYTSNEQIWDEVRAEDKERFEGASYKKLRQNKAKGLQWPIGKTDTPILHIESFRTVDSLGHFKYNRYNLRGMVAELIDGCVKSFYLTTGRVIAHYNNSAQTRECADLKKRYENDIVLVSSEDADFFQRFKKIVLYSKYGKSAPLKYKVSKTVKKRTLFVTFHHPQSKINFLFGDSSDELSKTAAFKSIKVEVEGVK